MKDYKFTRGPWKVNELGKHWNNDSLVHLEVTFGDDGECICDTVYERSDADLIAAAPELLNALEAMLLFCKPTKSNAAAIRNAHLVIAKALGESK